MITARPAGSLLWAAVLSLATSGWSQLDPVPPDLVVYETAEVMGFRGLHRYSWTGTEYYRAPLAAPAAIWGEFLTDEDNVSIVGGTSSAGPHPIYKVSPQGVVTTLFKLERPDFPFTFVPHHTGGFVFYRFHSTPFRLSLELFSRHGVHVRTIARDLLFGYHDQLQIRQDLDSGDYILTGQSDYRGSPVLRVTEEGSVTTIVPQSPPLQPIITPGWDQSWLTREWFGYAAWFGQPQFPYGPGVSRYISRFSFDPFQPTSVLWSLSSIGQLWGGVRVYRGKEVITLLNEQPGFRNLWVVRISIADGTAVAHRVVPWDYGYRMPWNIPFAIVGRRNLAGSGPALEGTDYHLRVNFQGHPGRSYVIGASLGIRPGIPSGSRTVPLNPDWLFWRSLSNPETFQRFQGTLDGTGRATAVFRIPRGESLRGRRVFFAAVVHDGREVLEISDPIGVTIG